MINKSKRNIRKSKKKSKKKNISKRHKKHKKSIKKYDSVGTKRKSESIPPSPTLSPTSLAIFKELMSSPLSLYALSPLPNSPLQTSSYLPSPIFSIPPSPFFENNYDKLNDELDKLYDEYIKVKNDKESSETDINEAYRKYKSLYYRLNVKPRLVYKKKRTVPLLQEFANKRERKGGRFVKK